MYITNANAQPYVLQSKTSDFNGNYAGNNGENHQPENTNSSAASAPNVAIITASLVSSSVQATLLRLQETGSVFDAKDASLMNVRGVSDPERQRFAEIVVDAAQTGGYNDPVAYIQSLPDADIEVLRRVHSLAETSGVTNTDVEGAINLLLPRREHVDLNNDGLVKNGAATGFYFPPPNSPQSVKDAWDETTKDMSFAEKMMAEVQFMVASIGANTKTDSDGNIIGIYEYTDPEYTNIFPTSQGGWKQFLDRFIAEYTEAVKRTPELADRLAMLKEFSGNLHYNAYV